MFLRNAFFKGSHAVRCDRMNENIVKEDLFDTLNDVQTGIGFGNIRDFAGLQTKCDIFKRLLHLSA